MTRLGAIRLGDSHTGGGQMIEASGVPIDGIAQCVLGDQADCATHGGKFALVSTGDSGALFNGTPLVFEPARLECGCQVSSTCVGRYART